MRALVCAFAVAMTLLAAAAPVCAAARGATQAAALLGKAEASFAALRADARAQRQRQNFTRVLDAYRRVFEKYPATRQGERALLRAGELQTLLFRWTGQHGDLTRAQNYYQRLIQTAPKSQLVDDALLAIAYIHLDHFKDPAEAWLRFRDVVRMAPAGDKAPEAKRQLKRLERYAVAEPPAAVDSGAELSCPTPQPRTDPAAQPSRAPAGARQPVAAAPPPAAPAPAPPGMPAVLNRIREIRHWSNPEYSRVVIDLDRKTNFYSNLLEDRAGGGRPPRLYVDLFNSLVEERFCKPVSVNDGILLGIRAGQYTPDSVRVVLDIDRLATYRVFPMQDPFRIVIDVTGGEPATPPAALVAAGTPSADDVPATPAPAATQPPVSARLSPPAPAEPDAPVDPTAPVPVPELLPMPSLLGVAQPNAPSPSPAATPPEPDSATAARVPAAPATASPPPAKGPSAAPPSPARPEPKRTPASPARSARAKEAVRSAAPPASAKLSLARQLGLGVRRVVIDAGHGAHDPGAIGVGGLQEKEVTLDIALRVRDVLEAAGYETVLTRDRDVYLPLEERTALANTARGDLFLSIHCNASDSGNLSGVETYWLNLASSRRAIATAARENSMALANMSDLQDLLKEIYTSKMDESSRFAEALQRSLHGTLSKKYRDIKNLGVKQAPFYVLIGAQMPSVLAEVSFINHRTEGRRLADPGYRQLVAQAIADGVKRYVRTVKTAALDTGANRTP